MTDQTSYEPTDLYDKANKLLEHALAEEFEGTQAKVGFELEQRITRAPGKDPALSESEVESIQTHLQQQTVDGIKPFKRFYSPDQLHLDEQYETTTDALPVAQGVAAIRAYKEHCKEWLESGDLGIKDVTFEPIHEDKLDSSKDFISSLHSNVSFSKPDNTRSRRIPPSVIAMTLEALRENAALLIENAETYVGDRKRTFTHTDGHKNVHVAICLRENSETYTPYMELRVADAQADPGALGMVTLLGIYLGLAHPEAAQTKDKVMWPSKTSTMVHWFKKSTLLKDTLDELSSHYGDFCEKEGIPKGLGSLIHKTAVDQFKGPSPSMAEAIDIDIPRIATFAPRGRQASGP